MNFDTHERTNLSANLLEELQIKGVGGTCESEDSATYEG
jgi:hypothetical protein